MQSAGQRSRRRLRPAGHTGAARPSIAVIGGAIMDLMFEAERMPEIDESLDASSLKYAAGGKGSNTAVAISRAQHERPILADGSTGNESGIASPNAIRILDDRSIGAVVKRGEIGVYLNTAVGEDTFGETLKKNLKSNYVDISGVRTSPGETTGTCAVFVESFTRQSRDIGFPGANTKWTPEYQDSVECLADGNRPDLIVTHLENKRATIEKLLETAFKAGVHTLLNPSPVTFLLKKTYKWVTHLVLNEKEGAQLAFGDEKGSLDNEDAWKRACEVFIQYGVKHVVITLGDKGAFWASQGKTGMVPAVEVDINDVKDTTGAG